MIRFSSTPSFTYEVEVTEVRAITFVRRNPCKWFQFDLLSFSNRSVLTFACVTLFFDNFTCPLRIWTVVFVFLVVRTSTVQIQIFVKNWLLWCIDFYIPLAYSPALGKYSCYKGIELSCCLILWVNEHASSQSGMTD